MTRLVLDRPPDTATPTTPVQVPGCWFCSHNYSVDLHFTTTDQALAAGFERVHRS